METVSERSRQTGGADFLLGGGDVVFEPVQLDDILAEVERDIGGGDLPVARLADGADIQEIFTPNFELDAGLRAGLDAAGSADESDRNMGVPVKTDLRVLVVETSSRG